MYVIFSKKSYFHDSVPLTVELLSL